MELNWYDYSARQMDNAVPRFTSVDPLAEKYYSISPYEYVMNNAIDPKGDSIWYTTDKTAVTMYMTGKLINASSDNIDMKSALLDISNAVSNAFGGSFEINGVTYDLKTDIQLSIANSVDDVVSSDYVIAIQIDIQDVMPNFLF